MENLTIRRAETCDIPALLKLLRQVLEVHVAIRPDVFIPCREKYTAEEIEQILLNEQTPVFIACSENEGCANGGAVLGHIFLTIIPPKKSNVMREQKILFVNDLVVDEKCRGLGVGSALLEFAKAFAKKQGCDTLILNVWSGNDAAVSFYEKAGMRVREQRMEYKI